MMVRWVVLVMICVVSAAWAGDGQRKELEEYGCALALPAEGWQWLEEGEAKDAVLAARDDKGLMLKLLVEEVGEGATLDNEFARRVEELALVGDKIKKLGGRHMTYLTVPAYQMDVVDSEKTLYATIRILIANDTVYQLQVISRDDPRENREAVDALMSGFTFLGEPTVNKPNPGSRGLQYFMASQWLTYVAVLLLLLVIGALVWNGIILGRMAKKE
jgi:hypothetical protein